MSNGGIRWVPAKSSRMGQEAPVKSPVPVPPPPPMEVPVVAPTPTPTAEPAADKEVLHKFVYGGLIVAGLAFVMALSMGTD